MDRIYIYAPLEAGNLQNLLLLVAQLRNNIDQCSYEEADHVKAIKEKIANLETEVIEILNNLKCQL